MKPLVEEWKSIKGYEGRYEVSTHGRVRSLDRVEVVSEGRHPHTWERKRKGRVKKTTINKLGYEQVPLNSGKVKLHLVHRLVAEAFILNPNLLPEVNHINGIKSDNILSNLEWSDRVSNSLHGTRVLGKNRGEDNTFAKLSEEDVLEIKCLLDSEDVSMQSIADMFNVTVHAIFRIKHGYNWSWLTGYGKEGR